MKNKITLKALVTLSVLLGVSQVGMAQDINATDFLRGNFTDNNLTIADKYMVTKDKDKDGNAIFDQVILKDLNNTVTTIHTNKPIYTYTDKDADTSKNTKQNAWTSYSLMGNVQLGAAPADANKTLRFVISRDYNQSAPATVDGKQRIRENGLISNSITRDENYIHRFDVIVGSNIEVNASQKDDVNFIYVGAPNVSTAYPNSWQNSPNGTFISFGQNVKATGLDGNSSFIDLQVNGQDQGIATAVFLNHKGAQTSADITKNYFGDDLLATTCLEKSASCFGNGYGVYGSISDKNDIANLADGNNSWVSSNAGRGFYPEYNGTLSGDSYNAFSMRDQNTTLGKTIAISGDIDIIARNDSGTYTRLYANFEGNNSHYYGDINGNGGLYLAFIDGAKFKGNADGSLSVVGGIEESNSTASIKDYKYTVTENKKQVTKYSLGHRNIYFGFADGNNTAKSQFDVNISGGLGTSKYVIDNLTYTTSTGNALSDAGITFDSDANGSAWVVRSNITMANDINFTGADTNTNKIVKYLFGNEYVEGYGGDYAEYIKQGYGNYTLRRSDSNASALVSDANIGSSNDNIKKDISFVFKKGTFNISQQGYEGNITGGTDDSSYYIKSAGWIDLDQLGGETGDLKGKLSIIDTQIRGILGKGNNSRNIDFDYSSNDNRGLIDIVGSGKKEINFDFTGNTAIKDINSSQKVYAVGNAPGSQYAIYNAGDLNTTKTSIINPSDFATTGATEKNITHTNSILGAFADAGIVFGISSLEANNSRLSGADMSAGPAAGTKFIVRGTNITGNLLENNLSLDLAFGTITGTTVYDNNVQASTLKANDINLSNNSANQNLTFIGDTAWTNLAGGKDVNLTLGKGNTTLHFEDTALNNLKLGTGAADYNATSGSTLAITLKGNAGVDLNVSQQANGTKLNIKAEDLTSGNVHFDGTNGALNAGVTVYIKDSNVTGSNIKINNSTGTNAGTFKIHNTNAGVAKLGLIQNGNGNNAGSKDNLVSLRFGQGGLESTSEFNKTRYNDKFDLNGSKVTTIALGKLGNPNNRGQYQNNVNHIEIKSNNAGGIIELAATNGSTYTRAGKYTDNQYILIASQSNIDLKGTSVVGDIIAREGTYLKAIFASGDGIGDLNNTSNANYIADSKHYGGVIVGAHNANHTAVTAGIDSFGAKNTAAQGFWFVGKDSHNFKSGKVDANNTIAPGNLRDANGYRGWTTFRFANADNLDGELFSNFSTNANAINSSNNIFNLVGTSIHGDINAEKNVSTLGTWTQRKNGGAVWTLNATFDNRDNNATPSIDGESNATQGNVNISENINIRGTTDAFGLIDANNTQLNIAKSEMNGSMHLGSNAIAKLKFYGIGSHAFTKEDNKSISGTRAGSTFTFNEAFDANNSFTFDAFKTTNATITILNSDVNASNGTYSNAQKFTFYFYEANATNEDTETDAIKIALGEEFKENKLTGAFGSDVNNTTVIFIGRAESNRSLYNSLLKNSTNTIKFIDAGDVTFDGHMAYQTFGGVTVTTIDITGTNKAKIEELGNTNILYDSKTYAASGSGKDVVGETISYAGANLGNDATRPTTADEFKNELAYTKFINYFDNASIKHDLTLDFNGSALIDNNKSKMIGIIQGAGKNSRYTIANLGSNLATLDANKTLKTNLVDAKGDKYITSDNNITFAKITKETNTTTTSANKTISTSNMSGLQVALINSGVKFFVDGNDTNKSGTTIGLKGTDLNLSEGYKLSDAGSNKFGYDLAFDDNGTLNGDLNFSGNANEIMLSLNGKNALEKNATEIALGTGENILDINATGDKVIELKAESNGSSEYKINGAKIVNIAGEDSVFDLKNGTKLDVNGTSINAINLEGNATAIKTKGINTGITIANTEITVEANGSVGNVVGIDSTHTALNLADINISVSGNVATGIKIEDNATDGKGLSINGGNIEANATSGNAIALDIKISEKNSTTSDLIDVKGVNILATSVEGNATGLKAEGEYVGIGNDINITANTESNSSAIGIDVNSNKITTITNLGDINVSSKGNATAIDIIAKGNALVATSGDIIATSEGNATAIGIDVETNGIATITNSGDINVSSKEGNVTVIDIIAKGNAIIATSGNITANSNNNSSVSGINVKTNGTADVSIDGNMDLTSKDGNSTALNVVAISNTEITTTGDITTHTEGNGTTHGINIETNGTLDIDAKGNINIFSKKGRAFAMDIVAKQYTSIATEGNITVATESNATASGINIESNETVITNTKGNISVHSKEGRVSGIDIVTKDDAFATTEGNITVATESNATASGINIESNKSAYVIIKGDMNLTSKQGDATSIDVMANNTVSVITDGDIATNTEGNGTAIGINVESNKSADVTISGAVKSTSAEGVVTAVDVAANDHISALVTNDGNITAIANGNATATGINVESNKSASVTISGTVNTTSAKSNATSIDVVGTDVNVTIDGSITTATQSDGLASGINLESNGTTNVRISGDINSTSKDGNAKAIDIASDGNTSITAESDIVVDAQGAGNASGINLQTSGTANVALSGNINLTSIEGNISGIDIISKGNTSIGINSDITANSKGTGTPTGINIETNGSTNVAILGDVDTTSAKNDAFGVVVKGNDVNFTNKGDVKAIAENNDTATGIYLLGVKEINNAGHITAIGDENSTGILVEPTEDGTTLVNTGNINSSGDAIVIKTKDNQSIDITNQAVITRGKGKAGIKLEGTGKATIDTALIMGETDGFVEVAGNITINELSTTITGGDLKADLNATAIVKGTEINTSVIDIAVADSLKDLLEIDYDKTTGAVTKRITANKAAPAIMDKMVSATVESQSAKLSSQLGAHLTGVAHGSGSNKDNKSASSKYRLNKLQEAVAVTSTGIATDAPSDILRPEHSKSFETFMMPYYSRSSLNGNNIKGDTTGRGFIVGLTALLGEDKDYLVGLHVGMENRYGNTGGSDATANSNYSTVDSIMAGLHARGNILKFENGDILFARGEFSYINSSVKHTPSGGSLSKQNAAGINTVLLAGYDKKLSDDKVITGELGINLQHVALGNTAVNITGTNPIINPAHSRSNVFGLANVRYAQSFMLTNYALIPNVGLGAKYLFTDANIENTIIQDATTFKDMETRNSFAGILDVGVSVMHLNDVFNLSLNYSGEFGSYMTTHNIYGKVGVRF